VVAAVAVAVAAPVILQREAQENQDLSGTDNSCIVLIVWQIISVVCVFALL